MLYRTYYGAVSLELAQVLPQHFDGYSRHGPAKLAESESAVAETNDHGFPTPLNHLYRCVNGALVSFDMACAPIARVTAPRANRVL
jgi:hypothetical protein